MEKKNKKRLGIVVVMLVLILAIGATAGTTLAKYISSATSTSTATVAQWGYTVSIDATNLFGKSYGEVDNNLAVVSDETTVAVAASTNEKNIVAPGTKGSMTITFKGTSEVNAKLVIDVSAFDTIALYGDSAGTYRPIAWKVNDVALSGGAAKTDFAATIKSALDASSITAPNGKEVTVSREGSIVTVNLPANTSFGENGLTLTISWEWAFSTGSANDVLDTILGDLAASKTVAEYTADLDINLGLSVTFEQTQDSYDAD